MTDTSLEEDVGQRKIVDEQSNENETLDDESGKESGVEPAETEKLSEKPQEIKSEEPPEITKEEESDTTNVTESPVDLRTRIPRLSRDENKVNNRILSVKVNGREQQEKVDEDEQSKPEEISQDVSPHTSPRATRSKRKTRKDT